MSETRQAITEQADSFGVESLTEAEQQTLATPAPVEVAGFTLIRDDAEFAAFRGKYDIAPPIAYPVFARDRFSRSAMGGVTCHYLDAEDIAAMGEALTGKRECDFCHRMRDDVTARVDPYAYEFSEEENVSQMCVDCYNERMEDI